jgi:UDP-N-acetylmuramoylalanine--D-glutamate ligase
VSRDFLPDEWRRGEIAVLGLGKSGRAVSRLLVRAGARVYASDSKTSAVIAHDAEDLQSDGIEVDVGRHDLERIAKAVVVVASPGIPPTAPPIAAALEAGRQVIGEVEVALRALRPHGTRYIAITGTNGKTTTTAIAGKLLQALGHHAEAVGNIGTPVAEVAMRPQPPEWLALEISSFQLHDTPSIAPDVGVLTNLSANHLDRYDSVEDYYGDKALLFRNSVARTGTESADESRWVLNADDQDVLQLGENAAGRHYHFTLRGRDDAWYDREREVLMLFGEPLLRRDELALLGDHNVANALAAALAVTVADRAHHGSEARDRMADALRRFRALEHRIETVGEAGGVAWINDSKSTNVASTLVALQGMRRPTVLLLGGRHKGEPYTALADELRRTVRVVLAYGESAPLVEHDLRDIVPVERLGSSFDAVIERARAVAQPGDAVLLSPACSSYDMFANYEQRGAEFKRLALRGPAESRSA